MSKSEPRGMSDKEFAAYKKGVDDERKKWMAHYEKMIPVVGTVDEKKKMKKDIEKNCYESRFPIPERLRRFSEKPASFNIQVLGARGAGKSTLVNMLLKSAGIDRDLWAERGEATHDTDFYDISDKVTVKPERYGRVFLCDQPGMSGLEVNYADYLTRFGSGMYFFVSTST